VGEKTLAQLSARGVRLILADEVCRSPIPVRHADAVTR